MGLLINTLSNWSIKLTYSQKIELRNWPRTFFDKTIYFQPNVDDNNLLWSQSLKQEPKKEAKDDDHYWNTGNVVVIPVLLLILAKLSLVLSRSPPRLAFLASKEQSSLFFGLLASPLGSSAFFGLQWIRWLFQVLLMFQTSHNLCSCSCKEN